MRIAFAAALALVLGCDDGGTVCNAALYFPGVNVELPIDVTHEDEAATTYDLRVVADGTVIMHSGVLLSGLGCASCEVTQPLGGGGTLHSRVWYGAVNVHAEAPGRISGGPRELSVTLWRDGVEVASGSFRPDYRLEEPNGPGCGAMARAKVTLNP